MTYRTGRQSPVNIWLETDGGDTQVAMATTPHKAAELVRLANLGLQAESIRMALAHHLDSGTDPCQDRGVDWPCDVADALLPEAKAGGE